MDPHPKLVQNCRVEFFRKTLCFQDNRFQRWKIFKIDFLQYEALFKKKILHNIDQFLHKHSVPKKPHTTTVFKFIFLPNKTAHQKILFHNFDSFWAIEWHVAPLCERNATVDPIFALFYNYFRTSQFQKVPSMLHPHSHAPHPGGSSRSRT